MKSGVRATPTYAAVAPVAVPMLVETGIDNGYVIAWSYVDRVGLVRDACEEADG